MDNAEPERPQDEIRRQDLDGELELWRAVLRQAVNDLRRTGRIARAARAWFRSYSIAVGSFEWISGQLGLESAAARRRILASPVRIRTPGPKKARKEMTNHLLWLKEKLTEYRAQLAAAQAETGRLQIAVERVEAVLEVFTTNGTTTVITARRRVDPLPQVRTSPTATTNGNGGNEIPLVPTGKSPAPPLEVPVPGQIGADPLAPLKRAAAFAGIPVVTAALKLLSAAPEPLHHDVLCRAIFDDEDFVRAKRALTSALSHAAKKGLLKQLGHGRYAIANGAVHNPVEKAGSMPSVNAGNSAVKVGAVASAFSDAGA